ncbi:MAG: helix-turn-helix domain-containing protein [Magnetococcales bacterium]|nr:helix-turn-helix domain-containing protein [Magnetococcales bacterium]
MINVNSAVITKQNRLATKGKKARVLEALSKGWTHTKAAEFAGCHRPHINYWRKSDPAFAQAFQEALEAGADVLEDAAFTRAVEGVIEDVYHQGRVVGQRVAYSDDMLKFLLAAARPEVYGRSKVEIQHSGSVDFTAMVQSAYQAAKRDGVLP